MFNFKIFFVFLFVFIFFTPSFVLAQTEQLPPSSDYSETKKNIDGMEPLKQENKWSESGEFMGRIEDAPLATEEEKKAFFKKQEEEIKKMETENKMVAPVRRGSSTDEIERDVVDNGVKSEDVRSEKNISGAIERLAVVSVLEFLLIGVLFYIVLTRKNVRQ